MLASSIAAGLLALALGFWGAAESLWVDELHTSWVVTAHWSELADRAAAGNQSRWYFYAVFGFRHLLSTVGEFLPSGWLTEELSLRLPSMIAWSLAVGLVTALLLRQATRNRSMTSTRGSALKPSSIWHYGPVAVWCLCILFDRLQWFYGVEARVYSMVQLLNLLGWLVVFSLISKSVVDRKASGDRWIVPTQAAPRQAIGWRCLVSRKCQDAWIGSSFWMCLAWTVIAIALVNLHITSLPSVLTQLSVLGLVAAMQPTVRIRLLVCILLLAAVGWLMVDDLHPIWDRRNQWRSIGGNVNLRSLFSLFPLLPILVPVSVGWFVAYLSRRFEMGREFHPMLERGNASQATLSQWMAKGTQPVVLWALAGGAPWLGAWILAWMEIAPLFHYRFVIAAALPLYLFAGYWTLQLPFLWMRWAVVCVSLLWFVVPQFGWNPSHNGLIPSEIRREGWREATRHVSDRWDSSRDSLWCSSGLIEGLYVVPPLESSDNEYLSYPLRGCYRIVAEGELVIPNGLVGRSVYWAQQLADSVSNQGDGLAVQTSRAWIVCRGNLAALESRLQRAGLSSVPRSYPSAEFGRVSVVCLEFE